MPFPLPLTPFERYYLADDRPEYPTTIPVELLLSGRLEEAPFRAALVRVVARHPLLGARVEDGPDGPQWTAGEASDVWLDWAAEPAPVQHPGGEFLDLRRQPGFRVFVRVGEDASRVTLQFHHACCDGLAVLQVVGDLMVLYAQAVGGAESAPALPPLPVERLTDRGVFDIGATDGATRAPGLRDTVVAARVWHRILFRSCRALAGAERRNDRRASNDDDVAATADEHLREGAAGFLAFETRVLDREASQRLRAAAAARGVTLNDLLLRDVIVVAADWNRSHGQARVGPLRVNVPVYVRGRLGRDIPASNGIGFSFVTVDPDRYADDEALLGEVHNQTQQIKKWKLALYFLGGLATATRYPRLMRWALAREKPLATVVLSYLGPALAGVKLPRSDGRVAGGNVVLQRIAGVPPVRPLTRASIVVLEYAGELTIALRTDPHHFRAEDARALAEAFVARLAETAASAP